MPGDEVYLLSKNKPIKRKINGVHFNEKDNEPTYDVDTFSLTKFKESELFKTPKALLVFLNKQLTN